MYSMRPACCDMEDVKPSSVMYTLPPVCSTELVSTGSGKQMDLTTLSNDEFVKETGTRLDKEAAELKERHLALLKRLEQIRMKIEKHPAREASPVVVTKSKESTIKPTQPPTLPQTTAPKLALNAVKPLDDNGLQFQNAAFVENFVKEMLKHSSRVRLNLDPSSAASRSIVVLLSCVLKQYPSLFTATAHRHSSVDASLSPPGVGGDFLPGVPSSADNNGLCFSIIWKQADPLIGATLQLPSGVELCGERGICSLLSVLSNLRPSSASSNDQDNLRDLEIDQWLDLCCRLGNPNEMNKKMRDAAIKDLNVKLGRSPYLLAPPGATEGVLSIADMVVWPVIYGLLYGDTEPKLATLPGNVGKWFTRCSEYFWARWFPVAEE